MKRRLESASAMRGLVSVVMLAAAGSSGPAAAGTAESVPAKELAKETYDVVTDPAKLPHAVQTAWALQLQQRHLDVAAAGANYNSSDHGGGTRHRLVLAAVSPGYAVVYFESGGIAVYRRVFVFSRAADPARYVWGGRPKDTYDDDKTFLAAIKKGKLWREQKGTQPAPEQRRR